jgi:hypothetical protein
MVYPGDQISDQAIPQNYIKEHIPIPHLIGSQLLISKYADVQ